MTSVSVGKYVLSFLIQRRSQNLVLLWILLKPPLQKDMPVKTCYCTSDDNFHTISGT